MVRFSKREDEIASAQRERTYGIGRRRYRRIPFGSERPRWRSTTCGDCGVKVGQPHVPGCDIEQCPACGGQAIWCGCRDDGHEA